MQQMKLLSNNSFHQVRTVSFQQIKARFVRMGEKLHEVILEINSNKFLINIKTGCKKLEHFEVVAVK